MSSPLTPGPNPAHDPTPGQTGGQTAGHTPGHTPGHDADTQQFGDLKVSSGSTAAYVTLELIVYVLATIGIFVTAAIIDENSSGQGFGAAEAWYFVTLLTVGLLISRGLAKIGGRGNGDTRTL